ncbi:AAA family ATPase [Pseudofrankia asymbiotica]|uniref:AAA family ATPase n=1 Tax=Pseudofrankia asymbiotica TaxID=1834516 RepID=A0A1V2I2I9_9ACTN|nr:AAA family ATPase [Pseudofrankia asymbiotica]ONH23993.1 AAA family ATPase [Pseudofrankia asymbiotica]
MFEGTGVPLDPADRDARWPEAPPWRRFLGVPSEGDPPDDEAEATRRLGLAAATLLERSDIGLVNAAMHLRRPLLITGKPGSGKSSLAYLIARELGLGRVLKWPVTSRTTLRDGVYEYDAIGRAQAALNSRANLAGHGGTVAKSIARMRVDSRQSGRESEMRPDPGGPPISDFIRLGPLGTAMVARRLPRVLLVDELDKGDFDLPNDLLNVFEDGSVVIPELVRLRAASESVTVLTDDPGHTAVVDSGVIRCAEFPIVIVTSNGEREFSPAFLRRCVRLAVREPAGDRLNALVRAHFASAENFADLVRRFEEQRDLGDELAADQLLNAVHLAKAGALDDPQAVDDLLGAVWQSLSPGARPR